MVIRKPIKTIIIINSRGICFLNIIEEISNIIPIIQPTRNKIVTVNINYYPLLITIFLLL